MSNEVNTLNQRLLVFTRAFQDFVEEVQRLKMENDKFQRDLNEIKEELSKIKIESRYLDKQKTRSKPKALISEPESIS